MPSTHRLGGGARRVGKAARRGVVLAATAAAVGLAVPRPARSQASPIVVEARGGVTLPVASFADGTETGEGASPHASFGVDIALPGGGRWAPYVGFGQHRFGCEEAGCDPGGLYVATAFHGGLRVALLPDAPVIPWLRVGAHAAHVETPPLPGSGGGRSSLGLGGEVGAGVHIGRESQVALNPGARLVATNTELPGGSVLRMRYVILDLGVVLSF